MYIHTVGIVFIQPPTTFRKATNHAKAFESEELYRRQRSGSSGGRAVISQPPVKLPELWSKQPPAAFENHKPFKLEDRSEKLLDVFGKKKIIIIMIRKHHSQPKPLMGKPLICNSKPLFRLNPPLTILSDLLAGNPPTVSATKGPFKLCSVHFSAPRVSTAQGWASNDESLPVFSCSPLSLGPAVPLIC